LRHGGPPVGQAGDHIGQGRGLQAPVGDRKFGGEALQLLPVPVPFLLEPHLAPGGAQGGAQGAQVDGLGDEGVHARLVGLFQVVIVVLGSEHQHVQVASHLGGPQCLAQLQPVHLRHHPVGQHHLGLKFHRQSQGLPASGGGADRVAAFVHEKMLEQQPRCLLVLHYQDAQCLGFAWRPGTRCSGLAEDIEGGHDARRHMEQGAPVAPVAEGVVHDLGHDFGAQADLAAGQQDIGNVPVAFGFGGLAQVGKVFCQGEQLHQLASPGADGQVRMLGGLMVQHRRDQSGRQPPILQQHGRDLVVVDLQQFLFHDGETAGLIGPVGRQHPPVFLRQHAGQGKLADAGQQAQGEQFVGGANPDMQPAVAHDHAGQQRMGPELQVVEAGTGALAILVHQGKAQGHLLHGGQTEAGHRILEGHYRPGCLGSSIGHLQQPAGQGRVGLQDIDDSRQGDVIPVA